MLKLLFLGKIPACDMLELTCWLAETQRVGCAMVAFGAWLAVTVAMGASEGEEIHFVHVAAPRIEMGAQQYLLLHRAYVNVGIKRAVSR